ncbi:MAG: Uma2 family endonuclease [Treponema sp.]|nr:Uma2 family endonuclease [Treponema sp.]
MSDAALKQDEGEFTFADYLIWDDEERWELIDGKAYMISSPTPFHQNISSKLGFQLNWFLQGKPCQVYEALGVRLFPRFDQRDNTFVVPDIAVVCDRAKLYGGFCNGPPNLIVEILSPSTAENDLEGGEKFLHYQEAGVPEYWIVDPQNRTVDVNILRAGRYAGTNYDKTQSIPVQVLPGCVIDMPMLWASVWE